MDKYVCTDGRMGGYVAGWLAGWLDGCIHTYIHEWVDGEVWNGAARLEII